MSSPKPRGALLSPAPFLPSPPLPIPPPQSLTLSLPLSSTLIHSSGTPRTGSFFSPHEPPVPCHNLVLSSGALQHRCQPMPGSASVAELPIPSPLTSQPRVSNCAGESWLEHSSCGEGVPGCQHTVGLVWGGAHALSKPAVSIASLRELQKPALSTFLK